MTLIGPEAVRQHRRRDPGRLLAAIPSSTREPMPARDEPGHEVATKDSWVLVRDLGP